MRMLGTGVHLQALEDLAAQGALGKHPFDGALQRPRWLASNDLLERLRPEPAGVVGVPIVQLEGRLSPRPSEKDADADLNCLLLD